MFTWVARHPLAFLIPALVCAVPLAVAGPFVVIPVLTAVLLLLSIFGAFKHHPAVLTTAPGAFVTVRNPAPVFTAAVFTFLGAGLVIDDVEDVPEAILSALWVLLVALQWWVAIVGRNVRLQPDGILDRETFGSLFIPWEALSVPYGAIPDSPIKLAMHYQQPQLLQKRGFRPGAAALPTGTDATYLAWVIHEYLTSPEHRPAIGTEAELHRLTTVYQSIQPSSGGLRSSGASS